MLFWVRLPADFPAHPKISSRPIPVDLASSARSSLTNHHPNPDFNFFWYHILPVYDQVRVCRRKGKKYHAIHGTKMNDLVMHAGAAKTDP
jgi:hypothetical protein